MIFVPGPLVYEDTSYVNGKSTKNHYVVGVASFGKPCSKAGFHGMPGYYAKVAGVLNWIRNKTSQGRGI